MLFGNKPGTSLLPFIPATIRMVLFPPPFNLANDMA